MSEEDFILNEVNRASEPIPAHELIRRAGGHDSAKLALRKLVLTGAVKIDNEWRVRK